MRMLSDLFARTCLCLSVTAAVTTFIYLPGFAAASGGSVFDDPAERIELGLFTPCGSFVPTTEIPLEVGVAYGWRLAVPDDAPRAWHETLQVPAVPREWVGEDFSISNDGRTAHIDTVTEPEDGYLQHAWVITEGDPAGLHEMRVSVEGGPERILHFVVR